MPHRRPFDPTVPICAALLAAAAVAVAGIAIQLLVGPVRLWSEYGPIVTLPPVETRDVIDGRLEALALLAATAVAFWLATRLQRPRRLKHWEPPGHAPFERAMLAFQGFGALATAVIAIGGVWFLLDEVEDRAHARVVRAHQLLLDAIENTERSRETNVGQIAALQALHAAGESLAGLSIEGLFLQGLQLRGANLSDSKLSNADLSGADLRDTALRKATLRCSNLENAKLGGASLVGRGKQVDFEGASLNGALLKGAVIIEADFSSTSLLRADFAGSYIAGADFQSSKMIAARFRDARLSVVNFSRAVLPGAEFDGAVLRSVSFKDAVLTDASFIGAIFEPRPPSLRGSHSSETAWEVENQAFAEACTHKRGGSVTRSDGTPLQLRPCSWTQLERAFCPAPT